MYVWTVELEERWDYEDDFGDGEGSYTVAAKTYEQALEKATKIAKKQQTVDDDGKTWHCVEVRLTNIKRGAALDA